MPSAIVIGATSSIARSVIEHLLKENRVERVFAVSRSPSTDLQEEFSSRLDWLSCDYSEDSIKTVCDKLRSTESNISHVVICNGLLHTEKISPEKRLEDISAEKLQTIFHANTFVPMLWLANLAPLLKSEIDCTIAVISARVGSIEDNRSGGWYAYRASKAALNMLIKTTSIEYRRLAPNTKLLAFHPGTTDTRLSKPFQRSVPEGKLFTPRFVANALINVMDNIDREGTADFLDWAGMPIEW